MALETGTYISDLVATNPLGSDLKSQGDDHIRLLKSTIKATFPNIAGAVTPTHTELNFVDGVTSAIQTQIDGKISTVSKRSVFKNSAQSLASGWNKISVSTTLFNIGSIDFPAGNKLQPTESGYYLCTASFTTAIGASPLLTSCAIYKNGAIEKRGSTAYNVGHICGSSVATIIHMNGTTDYIELYGRVDGACSLDMNSNATFLEMMGPF
jgi:hypothetical protein